MLLLVSFTVIISVIIQRFSPTVKKCLCDLHNNSCKRDYTRYSKMAAIINGALLLFFKLPFVVLTLNLKFKRKLSLEQGNKG